MDESPLIVLCGALLSLGGGGSLNRGSLGGGGSSCGSGNRSQALGSAGINFGVDGRFGTMARNGSSGSQRKDYQCDGQTPGNLLDSLGGLADTQHLVGGREVSGQSATLRVLH